MKCFVAMTGEITLTGRVLPIGGLREKTMAAYRAGIRTIIIPFENESDLKEVDKAVSGSVEFVFVKRIDEVLECALESMPGGAFGELLPEVCPMSAAMPQISC